MKIVLVIKSLKNIWTVKTANKLIRIDKVNIFGDHIGKWMRKAILTRLLQTQKIKHVVYLVVTELPMLYKL